METKGYSISKIRNLVKASNQDAFITDRYLYALILTYAKLFIQRLDSANKLIRYRSVFHPIPCKELIEVSAVEACCVDIQTCCTFMRTKNKIPKVMEGSFGPLISLVTSIDGSQIIQPTFPSLFVRMSNTTNFQYNKTKYYWYMDGYLYFPNIVWEAVTVHGLWEDSVQINCDPDSRCVRRQDEPTNIPDFMMSDIQQAIKNDLFGTMQIQKEPQISDNQSKLKN